MVHRTKLETLKAVEANLASDLPAYSEQVGFGASLPKARRSAKESLVACRCSAVSVNQVLQAP